MQSEVKVTICVITYNQKDYIARCLRSLVDQVTNFKFEIIVGDDCSSDGTRLIIEKFKNQYPDIIFPLFHATNGGPVKNIIETYKRARGEYICHMDGDDYALPDKLQRQVDVMDANLNCIICAHDVVLVDEDDNLIKNGYIYNPKEVLTIDDLYRKPSSFAHSSKMFRNVFDHGYWDRLPLDTLDVELHIMQAEHGDVFFIRDVLGAYRFAVGVTRHNGRINPVIVSGVKRLYGRASDMGLNYNKELAFEMMSFAYQSAVVGDSIGVAKYMKDSVGVQVISIVQVAMYLLSFFPKLFISFVKVRSRLKGY
ncbi:MAG: glycosyltransferase [Chitinophagaceae bacterium]|nr:glycosyltransferase [Chitinophagaceae bacterium]